MSTKKNPIVRKWREGYWAKYKLSSEVLEKLEKVRAEAPQVTIWLGGPGRDHVMHVQRRMIKQFLEEEGFKVIFAEKHKGSLEELLEFTPSFMAVVLTISPGAAGEALDFANINGIREKLYVYCPSEYKRGYIFRSLRRRHDVLPDERVFSLAKLEQYHEELPHKILKAAMAESLRRAMIGRLQNQRS